VISSQFRRQRQTTETDDRDRRQRQTTETDDRDRRKTTDETRLTIAPRKVVAKTGKGGIVRLANLNGGSGERGAHSAEADDCRVGAAEGGQGAAAVPGAGDRGLAPGRVCGGGFFVCLDERGRELGGGRLGRGGGLAVVEVVMVHQQW